MMVKVTLGIISKNEEKNIANTLKSVLSLDFSQEKYEIILVDGNSDDNTREIAKKILDSSGVKHKVLNEADFGFYGLCFARNIVIDNSASSSRYIAFTDADCSVDKNWLSTLFNAIKKTDETIAGGGGPRLIAKTDNKIELVINTFLTTFLASGGNPAFFKRNVKYVNSIANYNAIYKKPIISKFRYDDKLIISDDNELNYRLRAAGYHFINVPNARVWHRETGSIMEFARNMYRYGWNITNTVKKHRTYVTVNVPLTITFILYLVILLPLYFLFGSVALIPLLLYLIFALAVLIEVILKTRTIYALIILILLPVQHISYGLGAISNLFTR